MSKRFIPLPAVEEKTALKKSSIYAKVKTGDFPAPVKVGVRTVWIESEVDDWIDAQIALQRGKPIEKSEIQHEYKLTTREFAELNGVNQGTVLTRLSQRGDYFGIKPIKLANSRLMWPAVRV